MRPSILRPSAAFLLAAVSASPTLAQTQTPSAAPPGDTGPAAAPQPDAKPSSPPAKTPGTAATVVNMKTIEGVMGKAVRSRAANEDMGHIVDVLLDGAGQTRAAVIDFGGFLGVGSRKVAVDWKTLDFSDSIASGSVKVSLTRDQVRQAPEYKADEPVVVLEDAGTAKPAAAPPSQPGHNETAPAR